MTEWARGLKTGVVFSLSIFILHYFVEFEKILILIENLSPRMLVFVIIISFLRPFVGGFRTIYAVSPFANITHMDASIGYFISAYGSIFLPSAIGGDVLRMEHISRVTSFVDL